MLFLSNYNGYNSISNRDSIRYAMLQPEVHAGNYLNSSLEGTANRWKLHLIHDYEFDGIILDAPCSGSGTWGRTPEMINQFEDKAEQYGIGQSSSISGLLNGEWELLYSSTDKTRSSPFFWAFVCHPEESCQ